MNKLIGLLIISIALIPLSCGKKDKVVPNQQVDSSTSTNSETTTEDTTDAPPDYDPKRGEGKFDTVKLDAKLNIKMADNGEKIYKIKCASCHKLSNEKLVGPGWHGVTQRHTPQWIMNFITNPDPMISKDPELLSQLELCMLRMPNQGLTDDDARNVLEFMRKNDGVQ